MPAVVKASSKTGLGEELRGSATGQQSIINRDQNERIEEHDDACDIMRHGRTGGGGRAIKIAVGNNPDDALVVR